MSRLYILDKDHNAIQEPDVIKWGEWLESDRNFEKRRVAQDFVNTLRISTVFLGIDHQFLFLTQDAKPLIFETMVFPDDSSSDLYCERYSTWNEALSGHNRITESIKNGTFDFETGDE